MLRVLQVTNLYIVLSAYLQIVTGVHTQVKNLMTALNTCVKKVYNPSGIAKI